MSELYLPDRAGQTTEIIPPRRYTPDRVGAHRRIRAENTPSRFGPGRHRAPETLAVPVPRPPAPIEAPMERPVDRAPAGDDPTKVLRFAPSTPGEQTAVITDDQRAAVLPVRSAGATLPRPMTLRTLAQQKLATALTALRSWGRS